VVVHFGRGGACWAPGLIWCFAQRPRWKVCNDEEEGVTRPALMGLRVECHSTVSDNQVITIPAPLLARDQTSLHSVCHALVAAGGNDHDTLVVFLQAAAGNSTSPSRRCSTVDMIQASKVECRRCSTVDMMQASKVECVQGGVCQQNVMADQSSGVPCSQHQPSSKTGRCGKRSNTRICT
jgi:hypothetical protein